MWTLLCPDNIIIWQHAYDVSVRFTNKMFFNSEISIT